MEDPRDYPSARDWYEDGAAQSTAEYEIDCVMHADICARLNAKDVEIAELRLTLAGLLDTQCGPPMIQYNVKEWEAVVEAAEKLLGYDIAPGAGMEG